MRKIVIYIMKIGKCPKKYIQKINKTTETMELLMVKSVAVPGLEPNKNILLRGFYYGYLVGLKN